MINEMTIKLNLLFVRSNVSLSSSWIVLSLLLRVNEGASDVVVLGEPNEAVDGDG